MPVRIIDAFQVHTTIDERDSIGEHVGFFSTEQNARGSARGRGWYGGEGSVRPVKLLELAGRYFPLVPQFQDGVPVEEMDVDCVRARRIALDAAKAQARKLLTPEERELLGLK